MLRHLDGLLLLEHQKRVELGRHLLSVEPAGQVVELHGGLVLETCADGGEHLVGLLVEATLLTLLIRLAFLLVLKGNGKYWNQLRIGYNYSFRHENTRLIYFLKVVKIYRGKGGSNILFVFLLLLKLHFLAIGS